eukprot:4009032-Pleurochrysis_carterae.AAC.3
MSKEVAPRPTPNPAMNSRSPRASSSRRSAPRQRGAASAGPSRPNSRERTGFQLPAWQPASAAQGRQLRIAACVSPRSIEARGSVKAELSSPNCSSPSVGSDEKISCWSGAKTRTTIDDDECTHRRINMDDDSVRSNLNLHGFGY